MVDNEQLTPEEQADQARSRRDYADLDLGDNEYVIIDVGRSNIGIVYIWLGVVLVSALFVGMSQLLISQSGNLEEDAILVIFGYLGTFLAIGFGMVASAIYRKNYMIVSNRRVFARVQNSLFAYREQSVELEHIEDISVSQGGILQMMLNYGTIRLSTVGDEHTYLFTYVDNPHQQIKAIKKIVDVIDENQSLRL